MTLMELAGKTDDEYYAAEHSMKDVTSVYYKISYSEETPGNEELQILGTYYENFRHELNNELKLWEWIVFKIILPII
jgi:hypothetical protein